MIQLDASFDRPSADVVAGLAKLSPQEICDVVELSCVVRHEVRALFKSERVCGPAFTVRTGKHDNLMLHAAIYLAQPGDVVVVEAGDDEMAVAGGNVCKLAKARGVVAFVVDGVIRDAGEARDAGFPLFARGISPIPGKRGGDGAVNVQVRVGGAIVNPGDVVVADGEGIVIVPRARADDVLAKAKAKVDAFAALSLEEWGARHRASVEAALKTRGLAL